MSVPSARDEWPASAWNYLTRPQVTWRDALQGSVFLASSAVAAATVVLSARTLGRTRRRTG